MSSLPSVAERLLAPRRGPGACPHCLNLTTGPGLCRACGENEQHLGAVLPISYSVGGEWLHHVVAAYKRDADPWVPDAIATLARLCDAFVLRHEACLAAAAGVSGFQLVTTVPSADPMRDLHHPLRRIVGELAPATRERYERLLVRSDSTAIPRVFDPARYCATTALGGESVLLIDDMWTSGASAESAAAALRYAGAGAVAAIVIARHLNRSWGSNDGFIRRLTACGWELDACAFCAEVGPLTTEPAAAQRGGGGLAFN